MATEVSAQLVNLSAKAELKLVEAVAMAMPSGKVRNLLGKSAKNMVVKYISSSVERLSGRVRYHARVISTTISCERRHRCSKCY